MIADVNIVMVPHGTSFRTLLYKLGACFPAISWVGRKSMRCAWSRCARPDWMIWLAISLGVDRRRIRRAMMDCARFGEVKLSRGWSSLSSADEAGSDMNTLSLDAFLHLQADSMEMIIQRFTDIIRLQIPIEVLAASARKWRASEHRDKSK